MARINTNIPAVVAQRTLRQTHRDLQLSLERLSSGLRINRGADDPAGLINSEALRAEISGVGKAISNSQRAINIIATTEGALNEVAALLIDIQGLIVETANDAALSEEEKRANQLQIDSAIESITRISNTTTFAGRKLLNGSLDYITSGVDTDALASVAVVGAQFGTDPIIPVDVMVTTSAQKAELQWRHGMIPAGDNVQIEVRGPEGVTNFAWGSGVTAASIVQAVNRESQATGVEAALINPLNPDSGVAFRSVGYGSDQFVEVNPLLSGDEFDVVDSTGAAVQRDEGRDAVALVNGATARGRGLDLLLNTRTLDMNFTLTEDFGVGATHFDITGGGAPSSWGRMSPPTSKSTWGCSPSRPPAWAMPTSATSARSWKAGSSRSWAGRRKPTGPARFSTKPFARWPCFVVGWGPSNATPCRPTSVRCPSPWRT